MPLTSRQQGGTKPRILFLVPSDFAALERKGVVHLIHDRDENGFFERVVTVHPLATQIRTIDLDSVHRIYELGIGPTLTAPFRAVMAFATVVRIAGLERVDLVRATDAYFMGLLAWWVSRRLKIPFCVSVHADYDKRFALAPAGFAGRWRRRLAALLPPFVLPRADLVLPIREHLVAPLIAAGARRDRTRVIPHGIDLAPFTVPPAIDARVVFKVPPGAKVISIVGRLTADNYAADIATVIERIVGRRHDVVFVILGEGPEEPRLRHLLAKHPDFANAMRLLPFQSFEHVVALRRISMASLCLMAGFSLIEACAAGSPVVAYDVEWHRELVRNGETGYLVTEHDIDGVTAGLERILDDPLRATTMGAEAQRVAFARHDIRLTSQIKQSCYTDLLNREVSSQ